MDMVADKRLKDYKDYGIVDPMSMVYDKRLKDYGGIGDKNGTYRWIRLAIQMGAEEVNLTYLLNYNFNSPFSFEILSGLLPSKLKHLRLETISIAPPAAPKVISDDQPLVLHSLATLELDDVIVDQTALKTIFSTCVNLRNLVLRECIFDPNLTISGPSISNSNLKCLQILNPLHLEKLQVSLANLTYFEYSLKERQTVYRKLDPYWDSDIESDAEYNLAEMKMFYPKPKISFSNVPKLEEMRLDLGLQRYNQTVDDMFITADAPQLKRLTTRSTTSSMITTTTILDPKSEPQIPLSMAILCQLEQLELILDINYCNLLNMIPVLLACPLLQKFHLKHRNHVDKHGHTMPQTACSSKQYPFPNLKQVKIRTFYANCGNPFVFYLLGNAVALERIILDTTSCCPELCKLKHRFHEVPNQQIRAKVASPIAKLVYQNHSREK
ncbi:FBD-associated F-box protein [Corchorus olitorius]|uniref:FBD-associated F-box protein n=1 Tax=Corchorus olitorius TaxID=93759 RepID=A0A1R3H3T0_9ROSI|nr:FBD-associated F-box protein [Corchorus olitorius]